MDVCGAHGTFFDRGELVTIHEQLRTRKDHLDEAAALELKQDLADAKRRDVLRDNRDGLAGVLDLLFRW